MSGFVAVFGPELGAAPINDAVVVRMTGALSSRGSDRVSVWSEGGVVLGVSRAAWELGPGFSGPVLVVQDGDCVVVADASLYYRDDLRRRLAGKGVRAKGQTPSHLILAAYHAMGARCAEWLEGDFSFVLWDRRHRTVVAARDFVGRRPLFYASLPDGTLVLASTIGAILQHPGCSHELNVVAIAEAAAGYVSPTAATCYSGISRLHAGRTLTRAAGGAPRVDVHWEAPSFQSGSVLSFEDAAEQLRELLCTSTSERLARTGQTAVWLSGGRDSTAVFAAGQRAVGEQGLTGGLSAVSVSYPDGDSGCEDDTIRAVVARWHSPIRWLRINDIPLLDAPVERAAARDEPFAHFFECTHRALASATVQAGARVALDGVGGDQLFLLSWIYFADLLRSGRWVELGRAWHDAGLSGSGFRSFVHWAVQPMLPPSLLMRSGRLRGGRPLRGWLRRRLPTWIEPTFAATHGIGEFAPRLPERRRRERVASIESRWYFTDPFFSTVFQLGAACALEEGAEIRSPLYDQRIIAFAATRPRSDHVGDADGKRLLRRAMQDLLPAEVTATRAARTGTPGDYVDRAIRDVAERVIPEEIVAPTALADLGIVDPAAFERARAATIRYGRTEATMPLFATLQAELWLRTRSPADHACASDDDGASMCGAVDRALRAEVLAS